MALYTERTAATRTRISATCVSVSTTMRLFPACITSSTFDSCAAISRGKKAIMHIVITGPA